MASESSGGVLYGVYRNRIGEPSTHDEVRGYWVFLVGLLLSVIGLVLFLPSESAFGAGGLTLRELSIAFAAIGLAMLVAGFVIRLPLQSWANYAAYLGQFICLGAVAWFITIFPANWSVQTGNQPVIVLYAAGLTVIALGGILAPLLAGSSREELTASESTTRQLEADLDQVTRERDELQDQLDTARAGDGAGAELEQLQADLDSLHASQAQFELYADRSAEWRWRLRHTNGNIIADSGEGYTQRHNAQNGLESVRRNALGASLLLIESEADLPPADTDEGFVFPADDSSQAAFELYEDQAGEWRWRLRHDNGNIIADSGEGYTARQSAETAIERVRAYVGPADYLRANPTAIEIYRDKAAEWRWRLIHRNGNILADSGEGYANRSGARRAIDRIRDRLNDVDFEVFEDTAGEFRWRLRGGNNQIMADSGEGYDSSTGATDAVDRVRNSIRDAAILEIGQAAFEVYEDVGGEWRWRLRHRNGNILADSSEGYSARSGTWDGIERVKHHAPTADLKQD